ncbi:MAG: hypothetical protein Q8O51_02505 [bacterium]|nr:hypothetical protein [bacterium]
MASKQNKFFTTSILSITLGLLAVLGSAATAKALTISPPSIEFTVQPGNQAEFIVKLYNEGTDKQELYIDATTFTSGPEEGIPVYDFASPKEDIATWVTLDAAPIILEPQGRKEVTIAINVPADAAPGGHYGVVAFSSKPPVAAGAEKPQVAISQGIGTLLLVRVEGDVIESATLASFLTAAKYNHLPATFTTVYQNTGNIHLKPTGTITITGMSKKVAATLTINPNKTSTLPKSSRTYTATWGNEDTVKATATNAWAKFWQEYSNERANYAFGKYTATLALTAGQSGAVATSATTTFWVIPWHIFLVWAVLIILLILVLILLVKRYNHWVVAKAQGAKPALPKNPTPPKGTS